MTLTPTNVTIDLEDLTPALDAMDEYASAHRGWVNVRPDVDPMVVPPPTLMDQIFRSASPTLALGTWTPPDPKSPAAPQIIGVQHRLGDKLLPLLEQLGVPSPPGWRRVQDSPRRGLVAAVPYDTSHDEILRWLMQLTLAATRVETTGMWVASLHAGRGAAKA